MERSGRCGHEMRTAEVPEWDGGLCCWRPVWKEGRCVWHARRPDKPAELLLESRAERPERLDGAYLGETTLPEISLSECSLVRADFSNGDCRHVTLDSADLKEANFTDADISYVDLEGSELWGAEFTRANLTSTSLSRTNLEASVFSKADAWGADLSSANLSRANLTSANLSRANLREANLWDADLENAVLLDANLAGADGRIASLLDAQLTEAQFDDADLEDADLTDANARGATYDSANLEDATFIRTELRDASLENARLYQTLFADTRINSNTDFGEKSAYEDTDADLGENYEDTSRWEAAAWVYRRLQDLHEENAMSEQAREYHVRKEEAHRQNYRENGDWFQWFVYTLNRYLTRHGESLKHVVAWSIGAILACALAYPFAGGVSTGSEIFRYSAGAALGGLFLRSLYFSTVTFTTLGYGDYHPVGSTAKALAGGESLAGALLVALFVFVLGRRVAR